MWMWGYVGRSLAWLAASSALLVGGFLLLGRRARGDCDMIPADSEPSRLQAVVWRLLAERIVLEALLPHLLLTLAGWLVLARLAPFLERSWRGLLGGLPMLAALCFPVVGEFSFRLWTPTSAADYVNTLVLMSGGVSLALLLPRRVIRRLRPGSFARSPARRAEPAKGFAALPKQGIFRGGARPQDKAPPRPPCHPQRRAEAAPPRRRDPSLREEPVREDARLRHREGGGDVLSLVLRVLRLEGGSGRRGRAAAGAVVDRCAQGRLRADGGPPRAHRPRTPRLSEPLLDADHRPRSAGRGGGRPRPGGEAALRPGDHRHGRSRALAGPTRMARPPGRPTGWASS